MSAYKVSSGVISRRASVLGSTKNSIAGIPKVRRESISSLIFMEPSSAAKAAPVLPAITIATINAPISRTMAKETRSATYMVALNFSNCTLPTKAMVNPVKKAIKVTMGRAEAPQSLQVWIKSPNLIKDFPKNNLPTASNHFPQKVDT